jgi:NAD+ kinase
MSIARVGICLKPDRDRAEPLIRSLLEWFGERDIDVVCDEESAKAAGCASVPREELAASVDLVVAMGGDGTLLSVARAVGTRGVPILGINLGTLGFLTEVGVDEMIPALEQVIAGKVSAESRLRLEVLVSRAGGEVARFLALNDAVISNIALSRMIELIVYADDVAVTTYHADGLIVATPTGSTAYSLSAGGPLLLPGSGVVVLTPICPHSLTQRPVVFPQSAVIAVEVETRGSQAVLTVDGQEGVELEEGDRVQVRRSPYPAQIIGSPYRNRYDILRAKLRWGQR